MPDYAESDISLGREEESLFARDENDMLGFQFGGDTWVCLRQGLRLPPRALTSEHRAL